MFLLALLSQKVYENLQEKILKNEQREKDRAKNLIAERYTKDLKERQEKFKKDGGKGIYEDEFKNESGRYVHTMYHSLLCDEFVNCLRDLVKEVRGSQQFMDVDGFVTKRTKARMTLRKVDLE